MKILVLEDDLEVARDIRTALEQEGWSVHQETLTATGVRVAASNPFDVLIVDRMLLDGDGLDAVARLRELGVRTPALILSNLGEPLDRIEGLTRGADDYMSKPFHADELRARCKILSRRSQPHPEVFIAADVEIWTKAHRAYRAQRDLNLTKREFDLLRYLAINEGINVTKAQIREAVFKYTSPEMSNVVEQNVRRLRAKLEQDGEPKLIVTAKRGYVFNPGS